MMRRWSFHDEDAPAVGSLADWTFPINPNKMASPELLETVATQPVSFDGTNRDTVQAAAPATWSFEGVLHNLDSVDMLEQWLNHGRPIQVTDHFGRVWRIQLVDVNLTRAGTKAHPARHKYAVSALMLGRVT